MRLAAVLSVMVFAVAPVCAQSATDSTLKKLGFLLGKWTATAAARDTPLGAGQGGFSFDLELNQRIIVRHNHAGYASGEQHDDLMIIYLDTPTGTPRAIYFDSEGHVIRYNLTFPAADQVSFESDASQPGPRYRLSYRLTGAALEGKFEVAPPGAAYKTYMSWTAKKE